MKTDNTFLIPATEDFNFSESLWFLDRNYDDCMHKANEYSVTKAVRLNGMVFVIELKAAKGGLLVNVLEGTLNASGRLAIQEYIEEWLDVNIDLAPFYAMLEKDARFAYMTVQYKGLRLTGIPDLFEAICWAIIGQQINLTFAYKLKRKLVEKYGTALESVDQVYHLFPDAGVLAAVSPESLQEMQFSRSKAAYLIIVAQAFASKQIGITQLRSLPDLPAMKKALTNIKGVGVWTANYVLMKSLKERTCIPFGDAGLLNALLNHEVITDKKQDQELLNLFNGFKGWESYLVFYLWRSLSTRPEE